MTGLVGAAISTTGDPHRLRFLETAMVRWANALPEEALLLVTVDGPAPAVEAVRLARKNAGEADRIQIVQCGTGRPERDGRQGVAVNKNTGLEALMGAGVEHLFLSDDDTWPRRPASLDLHINLSKRQPHSMVNWGLSRLSQSSQQHGLPWAVWTWPRGVVLYQTRAVVEQVGGMVEEFGFGGHEHAEWSRRIHQHGLTEASYVTPSDYASRYGRGAIVWWHGEDMRTPNETSGALDARRRAQTSVRRTPEDWPEIERVLAARDGDTSFVAFTATENGRKPATLIP